MDTMTVAGMFGNATPSDLIAFILTAGFFAFPVGLVVNQVRWLEVISVYVVCCACVSQHLLASSLSFVTFCVATVDVFLRNNLQVSSELLRTYKAPVHDTNRA